jgi:ABC-type glycerol-3-phosphate transport system substrate-binding protein
MTHRFSRPLHRPLVLLTACVLAAAVVIVAAASGATRAKNAVTLTVLVDQTRVPDVQFYAHAHPELNIKTDIISSNSTELAQLRLALKANSNIPDAIFETGPEEEAGSVFQIYSADLSKYIPARVMKKFIKTSNDACMLDGKLLCLRNDLAQDVLWINTHLFQQFGYKVPQTWQQYKQLGLRLVQEHPGYSLGPFTAWSAVFNMYYGGFQCPFNQVIGPNKVRINLHAPGCQHMYSTLDPLVKAGALGGKVGYFASDATALAKDDKYLMMVGPSWWGDDILQPFYKAPAGEWTANQPPAWGSAPRVTGSAGGGVWMAYKKGPHLKEAAALIQGITTDVAHAAAKPTYPGYGPAATAWTAHEAADPFYSRSPVAAENEAAGELTSTLSYARFNFDPVFNTIVVPGLAAGKTLASMADAVQSALVKLAKQAGYTVSSS